MPDAARPFPVFDTTVPNVARMDDFMLDGKDNYASDREAVAKLVEMARARARAHHGLAAGHAGTRRLRRVPRRRRPQGLGPQPR
jgi:hypothetical protein